MVDVCHNAFCIYILGEFSQSSVVKIQADSLKVAPGSFQ